MKYQWNSDKAKSNYRKHGVYFSDAVTVFLDDFAITKKDDCSYEERFITIGMDAFGEIMVVVITRLGKAFVPVVGTIMNEGDLLHVAVAATAIPQLKKILGI